MGEDPSGLRIKSAFNAFARVGFVEERLTNGGDRTGPSLLQILSRFGYRSLVVNYLLATPPEEINGVFLAPGSPALEEAVAPLRTVSMEDLRGVKKQLLVEYELAADDFARSAAVTLGLLRADRFDLATFYTSWPDWFNHLMSIEDYESVLAGRFENGVPAALLLAYERIYALVGHLRGLEPEANIIMVSDHGVGWATGTGAGTATRVRLPGHLRCARAGRAGPGARAHPDDVRSSPYRPRVLWRTPGARHAGALSERPVRRRPHRPRAGILRSGERQPAPRQRQ